jgi:hypothetical protein
MKILLRQANRTFCHNTLLKQVDKNFSKWVDENSGTPWQDRSMEQVDENFVKALYWSGLMNQGLETLHHTKSMKILLEQFDSGLNY